MENKRCRLCAETKASTKLLNIELDEQQKSDVTMKLTRLNAALDFHEPSLPTTVCFTCITFLEMAYEFVLGVEKAQAILTDILITKNIKKEPENYYDTSVVDFVDGERDFKIERIEKSPSADLEIKEKDDSKKQFGTVDVNPELTWEDFKWKCKVCETEFPTFNDLKTHSMEYHNCCNAFSCSDCKINRPQIELFIRHVKKHRRSLKLACYICYERFGMQHEAIKHKKNHIPTDHVCIGCDSSFENEQDLTEHTTQYYKTKFNSTNREVNDLTCKVCNKKYKDAKRLKMHSYRHLENRYTCDTCGKCFNFKYLLKRHDATQHRDEKPFECTICKQAFKSIIYLRRHVKIHDSIKPFTCEQCDRTFRRKTDLKSHSIIHTDRFPFPCPHCHKKFRFRNVLKLHLYQHTGVKSFSCEICQRDFMNWSNCYKHLKRIHGTGAPKKKFPNIDLENIDRSKTNAENKSSSAQTLNS